MELVVLDPLERARLIQERRANGTDRWDEVWDGVYVLMPLPNNQHQDLATGLSAVFRIVVDWAGRGTSYTGVNVSDRDSGWKDNYRCPDVAVYLTGTPSQDCDSHWLGGPDFAIEIVSPEDRSRSKLDFYAKVGMRELLIIDRHPWLLEHYRLRKSKLVLGGTSDLDRPKRLSSAVLPLSFRLIPGTPRPRIAIEHSDGIQRWEV